MLDIVFTDPEDYIIKYMKNTDYYKELVLNKGEVEVTKREKFLNLED